MNALSIVVKHDEPLCRNEVILSYWAADCECGNIDRTYEEYPCKRCNTSFVQKDKLRTKLAGCCKDLHTLIGPLYMPRRPGHRTHAIGDSFMMDLENSFLSGWGEAVPQGTRRFEIVAWAALVKRNVFPHHSDVDWDEYCDWVRIGGGDEWFQEE
jgi:hypothetical protein